MSSRGGFKNLAAPLFLFQDRYILQEKCTGKVIHLAPPGALFCSKNSGTPVSSAKPLTSTTSSNKPPSHRNFCCHTPIIWNPGRQSIIFLRNVSSQGQCELATLHSPRKNPPSEVLDCVKYKLSNIISTPSPSQGIAHLCFMDPGSLFKPLYYIKGRAANEEARCAKIRRGRRSIGNLRRCR